MDVKQALPILLICIILLFPACQTKETQHDDLQLLLSWMTGSFSSQEQAQMDTSFYDIRLQMVRIWPERHDGKWLYVEQAAAQSLESPYRQRVYHLTRVNDSTFKSSTYSFNNPLRFAGDRKKDTPLSNFSPDSLMEREGCSIFLTKKEENDAFVGSTVGKNCLSTLRGTSYATSEVIITEGGLSTWDRGFNEKGEQVWGSTKGGYIFIKIEDYPSAE
jgi:CpeT protein